jgi:hypothetical protein
MAACTLRQKQEESEENDGADGIAQLHRQRIALMKPQGEDAVVIE